MAPLVWAQMEKVLAPRSLIPETLVHTIRVSRSYQQEATVSEDNSTLEGVRRQEGDQANITVSVMTTKGVMTDNTTSSSPQEGRSLPLRSGP